MALLALFGLQANIFVYILCVHTDHKNVNVLLINWLIGHTISDFKILVSMPSIINPNIKHLLFFYPISRESVTLKRTVSHTHRHFIHTSILKLPLSAFVVSKSLICLNFVPKFVFHKRIICDKTVWY